MYRNLLENSYSQLGTARISDATQAFDLQEVVFILRRIENDIDKERNLAQLVQLVTSNMVATSDVVRVIQKDMIKKEELLQIVAAVCYKQGITDLFSAF